jgi:transmembrane sensor
VNAPTDNFEEAADWFAQTRAGELDAASEPDWLQWIEQEQNQKAYENCELAWELSPELRTSPTLAVLLAGADALVTRQRVTPLQSARPRWRVPLRQVGLAASLLAVGAFAWFFLGRTPATEYTTAVGEQRTVTLADGSAIVLNTDSDVRVQFSSHLRRLELVRGEALFNVSHDPSRPFEVHALRGVTTAVGTQFDVELIRGGAAVSVLEGTVTVGGGGAAVPAAPVAVAAGSGVGYTPEGAVSELHPAEVNRIQGWRTQHIVFNDIPLDTALAEYNRYTHTPIVLSNPALGARHINGVFHIGDEAAFLSAIEQGIHLKATKGDAQTVLQPEPGYEP